MLNLYSFKAIDLILTQETTLTTIKRKLAEKNSNEVIESSQFKDCEETVLELGRKRCLENKPTAEEEPPTKKGTFSTITRQGAFKKSLVTIPEQKQKAGKRKHYALRRKSALLNCKRK